MQNLDLVFIQMSLFINFIRTNLIKMSLCCFINFLLWNCGLWIAKTNSLKFPLTLAHRRPPSWIQWIRLRGWFHGFTNPDSVSENLAWTNATDFETGFSFGLIKQGLRQRAFAFIVFDFENWVTRLCLLRHYFKRSNQVPGFHLTVIAWQKSLHCCI